MITHWDITSSLSSKDTAILYALLIDGTEHDARLIAKKLQGYVRAPKPALAPYVYRFDLPPDLDEDTLEKIRVAVLEGIEQAKKVNELIPGGPLGNPLFNASTMYEDKDFPTFLTLDPSESFFQQADGMLPHQEPATEADHFEPKNIDLTDPEDDLRLAHTLKEMEPVDYRSDPGSTSALPPDALPADPVAPLSRPLPEPEEMPAPQDLTSIESDEEWDDLPPQHTAPAASHAQPDPAPVPHTAPGHAAEPEEAFPIDEKDMVLKDMEHTLLAKPQPLDDIFLAETKYDMFVDLNTVSSRASAAQSGSASASDLEDAFDIFENKSSQAAPQPEDARSGLTQQNIPFVRPNKMMASAPAPEEDVMDPFEQLLSGAVPAANTQPPLPAQAAPAAQSAPEEPPAQPAADTLTDPSALRHTLAFQHPAPPEQDEPISAPDQAPAPAQTPIMENKTMTENTGDQKTFLHLKRKEQTPPAPPAAPQPPQPAAPQPPKKKKISMPAPKPAPAAPAAPAAPQPEPEVQRTILRRRPAALEQTRTIDHSIEMPLSELNKHNWPLEVPLIPTYTLENMTISINRFAHATAISVIDNPGKLYNPLVLHGASGTGKTHFLHAIGYALSKKFGQENIFITNGVRLSRGIQRYVMEGNIEKFEEFTKSIKALLIDDIHLISVNEQNREHLSKLLKSFLADHKQIVITSKYPPENLAKLEELLDFKLDSGWISDLKQANGPARTRIIQHMLTTNGINITNEDVNRFFGHPNMSLGTVVRAIRRVRVLEKMIFPNMPKEKRAATEIFDQLLATKGEDQNSLIAQKSVDEVQTVNVIGNGEWGRLGFFYPQNQSHMMNWLLFALQQRAKELGIPGGPELAMRSSYATENIISSAFKIANLCDNKKLKGAVILGPSISSCEPSVRENFYDILTHMLEIMLIRCGVINFEDASAPSTYVKTLAELLR